MVNYPHKLSKKSSSPIQRKQSVNFANRGMTFEKMINESNHYYLSRGLAVIHKKPTPIQIVKVDYPHRSRAKIVEAIFARRLLQTILVFTRDTTLILKQKRLSRNNPCR